MKKRQEIILRDVTITGAGSEGNAVARIDGMVVFVPYAAPGDVVDLRIVRKKKSFAEGRIIELKQASPLRV